MNYINYKKVIVAGLLIIFITSSCVPAFEVQLKEYKKTVNVSYGSEVKSIEFDLSFSYPEIANYGNYWIVRVKETNHNQYALFDFPPDIPSIFPFFLKLLIHFVQFAITNPFAEP